MATLAGSSGRNLWSTPPKFEKKITNNVTSNSPITLVTPSDSSKRILVVHAGIVTRYNYTSATYNFWFSDETGPITPKIYMDGPLQLSWEAGDFHDPRNPSWQPVGIFATQNAGEELQLRSDGTDWSGGVILTYFEVS